MTEDRSEVMETARREIVTSVDAPSIPGLLYVLTLFDRCAWLMRQSQRAMVSQNYQASGERSESRG